MDSVILFVNGTVIIAKIENRKYRFKLCSHSQHETLKPLKSPFNLT